MKHEAGVVYKPPPYYEGLKRDGVRPFETRDAAKLDIPKDIPFIGERLQPGNPQWDAVVRGISGLQLTQRERSMLGGGPNIPQRLIDDTVLSHEFDTFAKQFSRVMSNPATTTGVQFKSTLNSVIEAMRATVTTPVNAELLERVERIVARAGVPQPTADATAATIERVIQAVTEQARDTRYSASIGTDAILSELQNLEQTIANLMRQVGATSVAAETVARQVGELALRPTSVTNVRQGDNVTQNIDSSTHSHLHGSLHQGNVLVDQGQHLHGNVLQGPWYVDQGQHLHGNVVHHAGIHAAFHYRPRAPLQMARDDMMRLIHAEIPAGAFPAIEDEPMAASASASDSSEEEAPHPAGLHPSSLVNRRYSGRPTQADLHVTDPHLGAALYARVTQGSVRLRALKADEMRAMALHMNLISRDDALHPRRVGLNRQILFNKISERLVGVSQTQAAGSRRSRSATRGK